MSSELAEPRTQQPGDFIFRHYESSPHRASALVYNCPCGCGDQGWLPLYLEGQDKPGRTAWLWDGNETHPTLSPSIRRLVGCLFHGFLKAGVWSSAGDGAPVAENVYNPLWSRSGVARNSQIVAPNPGNVSQESLVNPAKIPAVPSKPIEPLVADKHDAVPPGFSKTVDLKVIDGKLHQLHTAGHPGDTTKIWVPVEGA